MPDDYKAMGEYEYPVLNNYPSYDYNNSEQGKFLDKELISTAPVDKDASWFKNRWRPAMAWQYLAVCLFDFIIAPTLIAFYHYYAGSAYTQWVPLTLGSGGLYHIAMGAIIGITAYGRSQEKVNGSES